MPRFYISHLTKYTHSNAVIDTKGRIMLYPITDAFQKVTSQKISINTNPIIETHTDYFENRIGTFTIVEPHASLIIESEIEVDVYPRMLPEDVLEAPLQWQSLEKLSHQAAYFDFLKIKPFEGNEEVSKYLQTFDKNTVTPYQFLQSLSSFIFSEFKYIKGITTVNTSLDEVWETKSGVCQDFTNFMLHTCKMMGIPARYVSGYLYPYKSFLRGESEAHTWIEAYIPNYGWLGFDPTNNIIASDHHVRLAIGINYNDCLPVKAVFSCNVEEKLEVKVTIETIKKFTKKQPVFETNKQFDANSHQKDVKITQQQQQQQQ